MKVSEDVLLNFKEIINAELDKLVFPSTPKNLYDPIRYFMKLGGKRMRPVLLLMGYNLFSKNYSEAIGPALAIELFHNFTLLHDDIMDNAPLRRNFTTVHEKWNRDIAILSGDAMMVEAYKCISKCPTKHLPEALSLFGKCATEVCEGQQYDMDFEKKLDISIYQYLEMIRLKTAVLPANALKIGAILGNSNTKDAHSLYHFGENLGLAFQLKDDLLDSFGDDSKFGKQKGGDILCNKKTYLLITALEKATGSTKSRLKTLINSTNLDPDKKINEVLAIYQSLKIEESTINLIKDYHQKSIEFLKDINVDENKKKGLYSFANRLIDREV